MTDTSTDLAAAREDRDARRQALSDGQDRLRLAEAALAAARVRERELRVAWSRAAGRVDQLDQLERDEAAGKTGLPVLDQAAARNGLAELDPESKADRLERVADAMLMTVPGASEMTIRAAALGIQERKRSVPGPPVVDEAGPDGGPVRDLTVPDPNEASVFTGADLHVAARYALTSSDIIAGDEPWTKLKEIGASNDQIIQALWELWAPRVPRYIARVSYPGGKLNFCVRGGPRPGLWVGPFVGRENAPDFHGQDLADLVRLALGIPSQFEAAEAKAAPARQRRHQASVKAASTVRAQREAAAADSSDPITPHLDRVARITERSEADLHAERSERSKRAAATVRARKAAASADLSARVADPILITPDPPAALARTEKPTRRPARKPDLGTVSVLPDGPAPPPAFVARPVDGWDSASLSNAAEDLSVTALRQCRECGAVRPLLDGGAPCPRCAGTISGPPRLADEEPPPEPKPGRKRKPEPVPLLTSVPRTGSTWDSASLAAAAKVLGCEVEEIVICATCDRARDGMRLACPECRSDRYRLPGALHVHTSKPKAKKGAIHANP